MTSDSLDALGPLMSEIGKLLTEAADGDPEGVFLYVEIAEGWVSTSIFKDEGNAVRWLEGDVHELSDLLFEAWYMAPKDKRWSVLEYDIKDGKFEVAFKYPEEVNVESFEDERREAVLRARYGDKPVIYPPPPEGAIELKP